jgi:GTP-binding protein
VDDLVEYFSVMRAKSAIERADLILFVVDSSGDGVTAQDRRISGLIQKANKPCVIVANKSDACE